jgi:hypothetical protein
MIWMPAGARTSGSGPTLEDMEVQGKVQVATMEYKVSPTCIE